MHKRAVEHMLEAELDAHLENEKHQKTNNGNYRNGHGIKNIKTSFGEDKIKVPRDRESSFEPILVPKRHNTRDGQKEALGMWLGKNESSSFWMSVLTDMKARGVEDILITATDNLNGFTDTIRTVFPEAQTQICVVHQIRNACK